MDTALSPPDAILYAHDFPAGYHRSVDDAQFQQIAKSVADPSRLAALEMISRGETSCYDVRCRLKLSPATVSHHIKELAACGLITLRREAKFVHASLNHSLWSAYLRELKKRIG